MLNHETGNALKNDYIDSDNERYNQFFDEEDEECSYESSKKNYEDEDDSVNPFDEDEDDSVNPFDEDEDDSVNPFDEDEADSVNPFDEDEDDNIDPFAEDEEIKRLNIAGENLQTAAAQNNRAYIELEKDEFESEVELPLFRNFREQSKDSSVINEDIKDIYFRIEQEENEFNQARQFLKREERIPYEQFMVLRLLGNVSYATRRQVIRYLAAWQKQFQWKIDFSDYILRNMAIRGLVAQIKKPVAFKKGALKGKSIKPYYLTAKGNLILERCSKRMIDKARFGEPNAKMMERLRHEVLISEVYIHHIEQGNYVYWIMTDEDLRRERNLLMMQEFTWRQKRSLQKSIGDFRIAYFDYAENKLAVCDGEVAVRYTGEQIQNKGHGLKWYCYDAREAKKINFLTRETATILDKEVLSDEDNPFNTNQKKIDKCPGVVLKWLDILGGLTIQTAAILAKIHYSTATKYLNFLDLETSYTSLMPGWKLGRGVKFYVKDEIKDDNKSYFDSFALNNAIQALHEKGLKIYFRNGFVVAKDEKKSVTYRLYCDSQFYNPVMKIDGTSETMKEKIRDAKLKGEKLLICISDSENYEVYQEICPDTGILVLSEHKFKYVY